MQAGAVRMRPVLLTAGTTMLGNLIITLDPVFSGLALAIIFGIVASTLFTLLVVPVVYMLVFDKTQPPARRSQVLHNEKMVPTHRRRGLLLLIIAWMAVLSGRRSSRSIRTHPRRAGKAVAVLREDAGNRIGSSQYRRPAGHDHFFPDAGPHRAAHGACRRPGGKRPTTDRPGTIRSGITPGAGQ